MDSRKGKSITGKRRAYCWANCGVGIAKEAWFGLGVKVHHALPVKSRHMSREADVSVNG